MRTRVSIGMIVSSCLVSTLAFAQPGADDGTGTEAPPPPPAPAPVMAPPPPPMPMPPPQQPQQPASTVDKGIVEDANAGRSWVAPTALTEPAGTWSFSDYELFLATLHYSPTDQLSLSATTLLPVFGDMPFWLLVNAKLQVVKAGNMRAVLQGAITIVHDGDNSATAGELGGALTYCIDDECHSTFTGFVGAGFAHETDSAVPIIAAGAGAFRLGKHIKLLLEVDTGYIAGGGIDAAADGFLGWYGIRFTSGLIGVDLGFVKPFCDGCSSDELPMGFPVVSFTYRALKD